MSTTKSSLKKILEKSREVTNQLEVGIGYLQRGPAQIYESSKELAAKSGRTLDSETKNKAMVYLGKLGINAEKIEKKILDLDIKTTGEPIEFIADTDLDDYLKHSREFILISAIEETKKETEAQFEKDCRIRLDNEWSAVKKELLAEFSQPRDLLTTKLDVLGTPSRVVPTTYASTPTPTRTNIPLPSPRTISTPGSGMSSVERKRYKFAEIIINLNIAIVQKQTFSLIEKLATVSNSFETSDSDQFFNQSWNILMKLIHEDSKTENPKTQGYFSNLKSSADKYKLLRGAREFLESQFNLYIDKSLREKAHIAQIGKDPHFPPVIAKVQGFIRIMRAEWKGMPGNIPGNIPTENTIEYHWAIIYYCVRLGEIQAAVQYAKNHDQEVFNFSIILASYKSQRDHDIVMEPNLLSKIQIEFKTKIEREGNPFQILLYNIIGQCDPKKNFLNLIPRWSAHDYIWHQINMVSVGGTTPVTFTPMNRQAQSLKELQDLIAIKYGPKTFNDPILYFQLLLLTLQFERALDYIINADNTYITEVVHIAIVLYYYGLLNQPENYKAFAFLLEHQREPSFNYIRLIKLYLETIPAVDAALAINYYFTIYHDINARIDCIKDFVLESKQYNKIFGDNQEHIRRPGILDTLMSKAPDQKRNIVYQAALDCDQRGAFEDAIKLYDLADEFEKMITLINKHLSRILSSKPELNERLNIVRMANYINLRCNKVNAWERVSPLIQDTFRKLRQLIRFFDYYNNQQFSEALAKHNRKIKLLPTTLENVPEHYENFLNLDENIRRHFGQIMLALMNCIYNENDTYTTKFPDKRDVVSRNKIQAKALINFVGRIKSYHIPAEICSRLASLETHINI